MDIHGVAVTQKDIDVALAKAAPATPAGFVGDACKVFSEIRPIINTAIAILKFVYPPGSAALAAAVVILEKTCEIAPK